MHPRATRNRPPIFLGLAGCHIYVNNINSPGFIRPLLNAVMEERYQPPHKLFADAISCFEMPWKNVINHGGSGLDLVCFLVEFWNGKDDKSCSVISVEVFAPSHWKCTLLLEYLENSIGKTRTVSIINTYQINGVDFPFNTINQLHYKFIRRRIK